MKLNAETIEGSLVVQPEGRIAGTVAREFQNELKKKINNNNQSVVIDFESATFINSAGLSAILSAAKTLSQNKGKLTICSLPESVKEIFTVSGFDKIIPIYSSRAEAIAASLSLGNS